MVVIQKDNQVHLIDSINQNIVKEFKKSFETALDKPNKNIELHLSSSGGSVDAAHKIIDILMTSYKPIELYIHNTLTYGGYSGVASAATIIAAYCAKKYIDANATFLIHHARDANTHKIQYDEDNILFWMQQTGQDYNKIKKYLKNETKINSENALVDGFVDDIIYKNYELPL